MAGSTTSTSLLVVAVAVAGVSLLAATTGGCGEVLDAGGNDDDGGPDSVGAGSSDATRDPHVASDPNSSAQADADADAAATPAPLGSQGNPATSCKALLASVRAAPSRGYFVAPEGVAFNVYCDMTTEGGGWTKVTPAMPNSTVTLLRGGTSAPGRQLLKCTDAGRRFVMSPSFTTEFRWDGTAMSVLPGQWSVDGAPITCGTTNEYVSQACAKWWGVGCGNGAGVTTKLYPGFLGMSTSSGCTGHPAAHANGNFAICDDTNFRDYSVFVRAD